MDFSFHLKDIKLCKFSKTELKLAEYEYISCWVRVYMDHLRQFHVPEVTLLALLTKEKQQKSISWLKYLPNV